MLKPFPSGSNVLFVLNLHDGSSWSRFFLCTRPQNKSTSFHERQDFKRRDQFLVCSSAVRCCTLCSSLPPPHVRWQKPQRAEKSSQFVFGSVVSAAMQSSPQNRTLEPVLLHRGGILLLSEHGGQVFMQRSWIKHLGLFFVTGGLEQGLFEQKEASSPVCAAGRLTHSLSSTNRANVADTCCFLHLPHASTPHGLFLLPNAFLVDCWVEAGGGGRHISVLSCWEDVKISCFRLPASFQHELLTQCTFIHPAN